jgi:hypothetical protein
MLLSRGNSIGEDFMKILLSLYSILLVGMLFADTAQAKDIYCRHSGIRQLHDGGEFDENWEVVNSSVRRVQMPGQSKPTTGCSIRWHSVGALYRPAEIIEVPRLGSAQSGVPSRAPAIWTAAGCGAVGCGVAAVAVSASAW